MNYFVLDENNNKIEAYSKEEVLSVLAQAIADGSLSSITADAGFISKLKSYVDGGTFKIAFITQAKYNELVASNQLVSNCFYYITDDSTCEDIEASIETINNTLKSLDTRITVLNNSVNSLRNILNTNFRRISNARKSYRDESGQSIYLYRNGAYQNFSMPFSNSYTDLIGLGVTLSVYTPSDSNYWAFEISTLWNGYENYEAQFTSFANHSLPIMLQGYIGVNSNNQLYVRNVTFKVVNSGGTVQTSTIGSIEVPYINGYYK